MKQLLEDMLLVLNNIPNRKLRGKDWTTYDLAKRVEQELELINALKINHLQEQLKIELLEK